MLICCLLKGTGIEMDDRDLAYVTTRPENISPKNSCERIIRLYERTAYRPSNLLCFALNFSPFMLWKLSRGLKRVLRLYLDRIKKNIRDYA